MTQPTKTQSNPNQVSFMASYVCMTKYDSGMFRIIEIPDKYEDHAMLNQKLKEYEGSMYIYINMKKLANVSLETNRKYKVYILFDEFVDRNKVYVLYLKSVLLKDRGVLETRTFNADIELSDSE